MPETTEKKPSTQLYHIRLTGADESDIAVIRETKNYLTDAAAIRFAISEAAEMLRKKNRKKP